MDFRWGLNKEEVPVLSYSKRTRSGWMLVEEMVRRWMQQRVLLTDDFQSLIPPESTEESLEKLSGRVRRFCQTLVDYISAGHFEIYNELIREASEFNDGSLATGMDLCRAIQASTDLALEFNDLLESDEHCQQWINQLPTRLVELGSVLNLRFELEDQLIQAVHASHEPLVA